MGRHSPAGVADQRPKRTESLLQRLDRLKSSYLPLWRGCRVPVAVAVAAIVCGSLDIEPVAGRANFKDKVVIYWDFYKWGDAGKQHTSLI